MFDDNVSMLMISIDVEKRLLYFGRNFRGWIEERCRFVGSLVTLHRCVELKTGAKIAASRSSSRPI